MLHSIVQMTAISDICARSEVFSVVCCGMHEPIPYSLGLITNDKLAHSFCFYI